MERSVVAPDAYWSFPSISNVLCLCSRAFIVWFHVVWHRHNIKCKFSSSWTSCWCCWSGQRSTSQADWCLISNIVFHSKQKGFWFLSLMMYFIVFFNLFLKIISCIHEYFHIWVPYSHTTPLVFALVGLLWNISKERYPTLVTCLLSPKIF